MAFGALLWCSQTWAEKTVSLKTDLGTIVIALFEQEAPASVANFLNYVNSGYYDGTIIHRIEPNFLIQGGGFTFDFQRKPPNEPVINEAANGLLNVRGTVAMARKNDPDSATSQFFINLQHNTTLDRDENRAGYTVFGEVIEGMDVIDAISQVETGRYQAFPTAPNEMVQILSARVEE